VLPSVPLAGCLIAHPELEGKGQFRQLTSQPVTERTVLTAPCRPLVFICFGFLPSQRVEGAVENHAVSKGELRIVYDTFDWLSTVLGTTNRTAHRHKLLCGLY
jgi:hypothetical protein